MRGCVRYNKRAKEVYFFRGNKFYGRRTTELPCIKINDKFIDKGLLHYIDST